ncbi:MAG: methyltransferase domain-containing protein [Candidatus Binatia bacterium]
MLKRGTKLLKIQLLLFFFLAGCAGLKQCAYEGLSRDQWQQRDRVIQSLEIRPGERVADLGSGSGYFVFALAKAVGPDGQVYAVDVDQEMNDLVAERAKTEGAGNVQVILARPDDPLLPANGVDLIFTSNTYHHIKNRVSYLTNLRKYIRPKGRIAIIEFDRRSWFAGLWKHYTPKEFIKREMEQAGYRLLREFDFLDRQSFLIFSPEQPGQVPPAPPPS